MGKDIFALIKEGQSGDKSALEEIIVLNEGLVWSIVKRFSGRFCETEDLYQIGCIGLIKAVQKFDFSKNVMFSTYAVPMIMGEIRKFLRDDGSIKVSRSLKELAVRARYISDKITADKGSPPTLSVLAKELDVSEENLSQALSASACPLSIYQPISEDGDITVIDTINDEDNYELIIDKLTLRDATAELPHREQKLLYMRYYRNQTQSEVAKQLGISQVQVSRIEKKVIEKLKKEIV